MFDDESGIRAPPPLADEAAEPSVAEGHSSDATRFRSSGDQTRRQTWMHWGV